MKKPFRSTTMDGGHQVGPKPTDSRASPSTVPELNLRLLGHLLRYVRDHFGADTIERIRVESGIPELEGETAGLLWPSSRRYFESRAS